MAQKEKLVKSHTKYPISHLPSVTYSDNSISSFDLLNSYCSAAIFLKAAADSQNQCKSIALPSAKPLSTSAIKQHCSSPPNINSDSTVSATPLISRTPCQHSSATTSKIQAAFAMAMTASSPPSTCPSSSSSGHQGEHGASDFRSDTQPSLGVFFRPPAPTSYETVDGGGTGVGDVGFPHSGSSTLPSFVPFTNNSSSSPDISSSSRLTNAMLLPANIVNVLGQQMHSNQYHQPRSPAYLSAINTNTGSGFSQQHQQQHEGQTAPSLFQSVAGPIPPLSAPASIPSVASIGNAGCSVSAALHEDTNNKREKRLLKNREAARECRRKKKEYVRCLERQVAILQDQNRQLIEELQKMKALCAGAFLDTPGQQAQMQIPPGLVNDRRLGVSSVSNNTGGLDFVDSVASSVSTSHNRKSPRLSSSQTAPNTNGGNANSFSACSEVNADLSASRSISNELTLLKSPVSQTHQQLLLLHGLSALRESGAGIVNGVRKAGDSDYNGVWMSPLPEQKPKFSDDELDSRPPSSSPHIHPVKRVLRRFGNEQYRLSQHQKQQEQSIGKPD